MITVEMKKALSGETINSAGMLIPLRVSEIKALRAMENVSLEDSVRKKVVVEDICVKIIESETNNYWIIHCRSGMLLPRYFGDYLLFENADDVQSVVISGRP